MQRYVILIGMTRIDIQLEKKATIVERRIVSVVKEDLEFIIQKDIEDMTGDEIAYAISVASKEDLVTDHDYYHSVYELPGEVAYIDPDNQLENNEMLFNGKVQVPAKIDDSMMMAAHLEAIDKGNYENA